MASDQSPSRSRPPTSKFDPETIKLPVLHEKKIVFDDQDAVLFDSAELPKLHAAIYSSDRRLQLAAACHISGIMGTRQNHSPISEIIRSGVIPGLVQLLHHKDDPALQFIAAWAFSNLACGTQEQSEALIRAGVVPPLVAMLYCDNQDARRQAAWALGNLACDCLQHKYAVLDAGGLDGLLECIPAANSVDMLRAVSLALRNLCGGKTPLQRVQPAVKCLSRMLHCVDDEVLSYVCYAFSSLSQGPPAQINAVLKPGDICRLIELTWHPSVGVSTPALHAVCNVVSGNEEQTDRVIEYNGVRAIIHHLASPKKEARKDACWALSNLAVGDSYQLQCVMNANPLEPLAGLFAAEEDPEVRREAVWALATFAKFCSDCVHRVVRFGAIGPILEFLSVHDLPLTSALLDALKAILSAGAGLTARDSLLAKNPYAELVETARGIERLRELTCCEEPNIRSTASNILEFYFSDINPNSRRALHLMGSLV